MNFSLSGPTSTFQKAMICILRRLLGKEVFDYLDNAIFMAATFKEHLRLVREDFILFRNADLTATFVDCKFLRKYIKYLGVLFC